MCTFHLHSKPHASIGKICFMPISTFTTASLDEELEDDDDDDDDKEPENKRIKT